MRERLGVGLGVKDERLRRRYAILDPHPYTRVCDPGSASAIGRRRVFRALVPLVWVVAW